jgi:hypothetical protein
LKTLLKEAGRIGEVRNVQMMKKEEDCEKLEQYVVSLRKSLRNSQVPKDLTHLGCMGKTLYKEDTNTNKKVEESYTQTVDEKWTRIPERRCRAADIPCKSTFNCQPGKVDLEEPAQEMQG